jgi:CRISPR/Cas system-associated endoribonuclease Cas2
LNAGVPSLLRCYEEWRELLEREVSEVCAILTAETDDGQRLRQNSPFAGILSPREVWEIKSRHQHATTTA